MRHVLPQVAPLLVATAVIMVAYAIFAETAIAFLGLGDPSVTSWGLLIQNAFSRDAISVGAWWAIVPPGVAVAIVVVSLTMMGTAIEDVLNPRLRVSHLSVRRFRMRASAAARGRGMSAAPVLDVEDLHVWFDLGQDRELHAVQGGSIALERGERMGLVGESGLRQDDAQPRADGAPAATTRASRAACSWTARTSSRAARSPCARTAGTTSRWSSRAR